MTDHQRALANDTLFCCADLPLYPDQEARTPPAVTGRYISRLAQQRPSVCSVYFPGKRPRRIQGKTNAIPLRTRFMSSIPQIILRLMDVQSLGNCNFVPI